MMTTERVPGQQDLGNPAQRQPMPLNTAHEPPKSPDPTQGQPKSPDPAHGQLQSETRWLSQEQLQTWVRLVAVLELLPAQLDSHLRRVADLTYFDYYVLAMLSEAPGRVLRMSSLATRTNATLPRLSHVARRLQARGLIDRTADRDDRRVTMARLTPLGWDTLRATAPAHVAQVRALVFDVLSAEQVEQLGSITQTLLTTLDPDGLMSVDYRSPGAEGAG